MSEFSILNKASGTAEPADLHTAARLTNIEAGVIKQLIAERGVCESIDHVISRPGTPAFAQQEIVRLARAEAAAASRTAAEADANAVRTADHHDGASEAHQRACEAADTAGDYEVAEAHDHAARAHHAAALASEAHGYDDGRAALAAGLAAQAAARGTASGACLAADAADLAAAAALARHRSA